jgi:hypothetical protein
MSTARLLPQYETLGHEAVENRGDRLLRAALRNRGDLPTGERAGRAGEDDEDVAVDRRHNRAVRASNVHTRNTTHMSCPKLM